MHEFLPSTKVIFLYILGVSMYNFFLSVKFWTQSFLPWFFLNLAIFQISSMFQTKSKCQVFTWTGRKSQLFSKCLCFLLHKFLKTLKFSKCQVLDLVIFALIFSEFGYVPRKSLGHRKNLEHSQIQKKSGQKWLSPKLDT